MQEIMRILFNSCKKTSELIDKQAVVKLSVKEKMQLQVHKSMCKTCEVYEHQSKFMDKIISNLFRQGNSKSKVKLSEERKIKIIDEINKL